jgi:putative flippase GtrA
MRKLLTDHGTIARFARFLGVGVLNTGFGYLAFAALVLGGLGPQLALALAFALGILWNYMTHARLVFGTSGVHKLVPYAAAYGLIYALNAIALHYALAFGIAPLVAQAALVLPMAALSFVIISFVLTSYLPFAHRSSQDMGRSQSFQRGQDRPVSTGTDPAEGKIE